MLFPHFKKRVAGTFVNVTFIFFITPFVLLFAIDDQLPTTFSKSRTPTRKGGQGG